MWQEAMIQRNGCGTPMIAVIIIAIILLFSSCATKTQIEYRDVVRYETKIQHDTLIQDTHDSVYVSVVQKGDTIYNTKYVEKTKWRDKIVYQLDTMYRDSIQTQIKETTIEKIKIPKWCYFSLVVCVIFIIFAIRKQTKWLTRN